MFTDTGIAAYHDLSADGKRNQFFQSDGSAVLYHDGCTDGYRCISEKLIALANACVGWMTGGMAMVNIVASYFFGGISGSASADTASIGSIMIQ